MFHECENLFKKEKKKQSFFVMHKIENIIQNFDRNIKHCIGILKTAQQQLNRLII